VDLMRNKVVTLYNFYDIFPRGLNRSICLLFSSSRLRELLNKYFAEKAFSTNNNAQTRLESYSFVEFSLGQFNEKLFCGKERYKRDRDV